jgi:hypothetical protein
MKHVVSGNRSYDPWLREAQKLAKAHLDGTVLSDVPKIEDATSAFRELFTPAEIKQLRKEGFDCKPLRAKLPQQVLMLAAIFFNNHRDRPKAQRLFVETVNTLMFRIALAYYIQTLLRFSTGADATANPLKYRNDMVDCSYVAYASFFDGLLTADRRLQEIYHHTRLVLDALIE